MKACQGLIVLVTAVARRRRWLRVKLAACGLIVLVAAGAALLAGTGLAGDTGVASGTPGVAGGTPPAEEQHCKLELVRLSADGPYSPAAIACRNVSPQMFNSQVRNGVMSFADNQTFKKVVTKEPAKYHAKHPFRGVATLGSKQYGFVLDKQDEKSKDYDRLYFDLNGNGDLTDNKPIDKPGQKAGKLSGGLFGLFVCARGLQRRNFPASISPSTWTARSSIIRSFSRQNYGAADTPYVWATLSAAVYRQGTVVVDGKKRKIAVLDYNSNGRFDDLCFDAGERYRRGQRVGGSLRRRGVDRVARRRSRHGRRQVGGAALGPARPGDQLSLGRHDSGRQVLQCQSLGHRRRGSPGRVRAGPRASRQPARPVPGRFDRGSGPDFLEPGEGETGRCAGRPMAGPLLHDPRSQGEAPAEEARGKDESSRRKERARQGPEA